MYAIENSNLYKWYQANNFISECDNIKQNSQDLCIYSFQNNKKFYYIQCLYQAYCKIVVDDNSIQILNSVIDVNNTDDIEYFAVINACIRNNCIEICDFMYKNFDINKVYENYDILTLPFAFANINTITHLIQRGYNPLITKCNFNLIANARDQIFDLYVTLDLSVNLLEIIFSHVYPSNIISTHETQKSIDRINTLIDRINTLIFKGLRLQNLTTDVLNGVASRFNEINALNFFVSNGLKLTYELMELSYHKYNLNLFEMCLQNSLVPHDNLLTQIFKSMNIAFLELLIKYKIDCGAVKLNKHKKFVDNLQIINMDTTSFIGFALDEISNLQLFEP